MERACLLWSQADWKVTTANQYTRSSGLAIGRFLPQRGYMAYPESKPASDFHMHILSILKDMPMFSPCALTCAPCDLSVTRRVSR